MPQNKFMATAGIKIFYGDADSDSQTNQVTGLQAISGLPQPKTYTFETTRLDQMIGDDINPWKQFEFDKTDPGELAFGFGWDEGLFGTLQGLQGVMQSWQVLFRSGAKQTFNGGITECSAKPNDKGEVLLMITIKVSGAITFTPAA